MTNSEIDRFLTEKGVKPTPNRILVIRALTDTSRPVSLGDLESILGSIDKAGVFRVLELLAEREIVHVIDDGSRSVKYELCHNHDHHSVTDQHVHFHCENCGETTCLEDLEIPMVDIPEGFSLRSVNYVMKGLCPKCRRLGD